MVDVADKEKETSDETETSIYLAKCDAMDKHLCATYPGLYRNRHGDMRSTAMCWGFECGAGWSSILDELSARLTFITKVSGMEIVASQVKEKYGTLRFYTSGESVPAGKIGAWWYWFKLNWSYRWWGFIKRCCPKYYERRRSYYSMWSDVVDDCISVAEHKSAHTCEICGAHGKLNHGGWFMVRCEKHWGGPNTFDNPSGKVYADAGDADDGDE